MGEMDARGELSRTPNAPRGPDRLKESDQWGRMDLVDLVRLKGHILEPEERSLLEAYLKGSNSLRQIARLTGMKPSSAWRRVRRLVKRLHACTSLACLEEPCGLTVDELAIVKDHVMRGLSIRDISRARKLTYYRVRNIILAAKVLTHADCMRPRRRRRRRARPSFIRRTESADRSST
jgi:hypothetical protein